MLKRFIIFAGQDDKQGGGWNDVLQMEEGKPFSFDTQEEASALLPKINGFPYDWAHIVDLHTGKIVA